MQHPLNTETHTKEILNGHGGLLEKNPTNFFSRVVPSFLIVKNLEVFSPHYLDLLPFVELKQCFDIRTVK